MFIRTPVNVLPPAVTATLVAAPSSVKRPVAVKDRVRGYRNRVCNPAASYLDAIPFRSPAGEWQFLQCASKYTRPAPALPVTIFRILYSMRLAAPCERERRKAAISLICAGVIENLGIPLSGRPLRITGPILSPFSSCSTNTERTRSGPLCPPFALVPWQNPQLGT